MDEEGREQETADTRQRVVRALDAAAWWFRIDLLASFSAVSIAGRVDRGPEARYPEERNSFHPPLRRFLLLLPTSASG